jgi:hypothetical protein
MVYEGTFNSESSSVEFYYRTGQKQANGTLNAIFSFKIDGQDQNMEQSPVSSHVWYTANRSIPTGYHILEWKYKKLNFRDTSDDLAAEIKWIRMIGTETMNKEC